VSGIAILEKLKVVNLSNNILTSLEGVDSLTNLEILDVSHNMITLISGLEKCTKIKNLNLSFNKLNRDCMPYIFQLPDLACLDIEGVFEDITDSEWTDHIPTLSFLNSKPLKCTETSRSLTDEYDEFVRTIRH